MQFAPSDPSKQQCGQQQPQPPQNPQQLNQQNQIPPPWWYNQNPPSFLSQQPQNIIVESQADKAKEHEAKLHTIMLCLFFIGGKVDWDDGKITTTCLPTNTREYNNIFSQPTTIRATQAANIVHTIFMTFPEKNRGAILASVQHAFYGILSQDPCHRLA